MRLPNWEEAHVGQRKLNEYLLNRKHPDEKEKSAFFIGRYGTDWKQLPDDLLEHAAGPVVGTEETRHGTMCVIKKSCRVRSFEGFG